MYCDGTRHRLSGYRNSASSPRTLTSNQSTPLTHAVGSVCDSAVACWAFCTLGSGVDCVAQQPVGENKVLVMGLYFRPGPVLTSGLPPPYLERTWTSVPDTYWAPVNYRYYREAVLQRLCSKSACCDGTPSLLIISFRLSFSQAAHDINFLLSA